MIKDFTPYQFYVRLLLQAHECSDAVDRYDLRSENPDSVRVWEMLKQDEFNANFALIDYCLSSGHKILIEMEKNRGAKAKPDANSD